jgi:hypothetical protein
MPSNSSIPSAETLTAFKASMDEKDRIVHTLAEQMLKTRYTPHRSNSWIAWTKKQAAVPG